MPNAHVHIQAIGALTLSLAGRLDETGTLLATICRSAPDYDVDDFLTAFHFAAEDAAVYRRAAKAVGLGPRNR